MASKNYSGRHGSGAWLRWFKRRYRSRSLPVVQDQIAESLLSVVIVFQMERAIFVMVVPSSGDMVPDDDDNDETQSFAPAHYRAQQIQISTEQMFSNLIESAKVVAQMKAETLVDLEITRNGPEAVFSEKLLRLNINGLFDDFFHGLSYDERRLVTTQNKEKLKDAFGKEYLLTIEKCVQGYREDGTLYSEHILEMRKLVRQDKLDFKELNPPELLRYLAAIRAIGFLKMTSDVTLEDLYNVRNYVEEYRAQYNACDLSKEVTNRPVGRTF